MLGSLCSQHNFFGLLFLDFLQHSKAISLVNLVVVKSQVAYKIKSNPAVEGENRCTTTPPILLSKGCSITARNLRLPFACWQSFIHVHLDAKI